LGQAAVSAVGGAESGLDFTIEFVGEQSFVSPEQMSRSVEQYHNGPAFMAGSMLTLDHSDWLRRRVLSGLSSQPRIFATQLAMHVGTASTGDFIRHSMLPLGHHLLAA